MYRTHKIAAVGKRKGKKVQTNKMQVAVAQKMNVPAFSFFIVLFYCLIYKNIWLFTAYTFFSRMKRIRHNDRCLSIFILFWASFLQFGKPWWNAPDTIEFFCISFQWKKHIQLDWLVHTCCIRVKISKKCTPTWYRFPHVKLGVVLSKCRLTNYVGKLYFSVIMFCLKLLTVALVLSLKCMSMTNLIE